MRASASNAAVAFAIANFYLLYLTGPLVSPRHQLIFHLPGSATALFLPVILDFIVLTAGLFWLLTWAENHSRAEILLWAVLLLPIPAVLVETAAAFAGHPPNHALLGIFLFFAAAGLSFTAARLSALVPVFARWRPGLATVLGFVSLSGLVLFGQLLWNGWQTRHLNPPFASATPRSRHHYGAETAQRRVVWIILDELSYRQIFPNRPSGLALPNFDRLAAGSTVFTATDAAAEYTRIAVPSLLTGLPLTETRPTADGQHLWLQPRQSGQWRSLDPGDTVFADTGKAGLPTGVAGWYEPYCRLLPAVLDRCFWTYRDDLPAGLSAVASITANALGPIRITVLPALRLLGWGPGVASEDSVDVRRHAADYRALYAAGDRLLGSQNAGLLLLHMPIPHPWGFYDRRTGTFPAHRTSYLDNLALADLYLGHVRSLMEQDGSWDRTDLVIMGDHGWRTGAVWRNSGFWTTEEEQASHSGTLVDRPAVFIKLAGQKTPARIDAPFAASRTRTLIGALFAGKISGPDDLERWVQQSTQAQHP